MTRKGILLPQMSTGQMLALGATGLVLTAGAIVAGAAMTNKRTRNKLVKGAGKGIRTLKQGLRKVQDEYQRYQPTALRVGRTKKRKGLLKKTRK